jgi:hypothetical protein
MVSEIRGNGIVGRHTIHASNNNNNNNNNKGDAVVGSMRHGTGISDKEYVLKVVRLKDERVMSNGHFDVLTTVVYPSDLFDLVSREMEH